MHKKCFRKQNSTLMDLAILFCHVINRDLMDQGLYVKQHISDVTCDSLANHTTLGEPISFLSFISLKPLLEMVKNL